MDSFEDIFSQEVALLHEFGQENLAIEPVEDTSSNNLIRTGRVFDIDEVPPGTVENLVVKANSGRKQLPPGCSSFPTTDRQVSKRKRAAFEDPARRAKVAHVRNEGACMRCRIKKRPCSTSRPCMSCISCWVSLDARSSSLKWMDCVPYSWKHISLYSSDSSKKLRTVPWATCSMMVAMEKCLALSTRRSSVRSTEEILRETMDLLIPMRSVMERVSKIPRATWSLGFRPENMLSFGLLARKVLLQIFESLETNALAKALRALAKPQLWSLMWTLGESSNIFVSMSPLESDLVGGRLLRSLEAALKTNALAKASEAELHGITATLIGTIFVFRNPFSADIQEGRKELVRILLHHLIVLAERLGGAWDESTKRRFLEDMSRPMSFSPTSDSVTLHCGKRNQIEEPDDVHPSLLHNDSLKMPAQESLVKSQITDAPNQISKSVQASPQRVQQEPEIHSVVSMNYSSEPAHPADSSQEYDTVAIATTTCPFCDAAFSLNGTCPSCVRPSKAVRFTDEALYSSKPTQPADWSQEHDPVGLTTTACVICDATLSLDGICPSCFGPNAAAYFTDESLSGDAA